MYTFFIFLISLLLFFLFSQILQRLLIKPTHQLKLRMLKYVKGESIEPLDRPLIVRLIEPITGWLSERIEKITPKSYMRYLEKRIILLQFKYTVQDILMLKLIGSTATLIIGVLYSINNHFDDFYLFIGFAVIITFLPDIYLSIGLKKKRERMLFELPLFLDLLIVVLEGGASFDSAIQKICGRKKGPLYHEFNRYIKEVRMGSSRQDGLQRLMTRVQLQEFDFVIRSILHSEKMGISILTTIHNQATQLRMKRKNQIREEAMKIPIKILFPLVLFIFPPIFIVVLGPAAIQITQNLF